MAPDGLPAPGTAQPGLGQAECAMDPITETSPEQRGSEVHTKKTVMIKTIETRDGEVSGLSGLLTLGGGYGCVWGDCLPPSCAGLGPWLVGQVRSCGPGVGMAQG